jgi:NAD(P)H-hydrate epimerase
MVTSGLPDSLADGFDLTFAEGLTIALAEKKTGLLSPEAANEILEAGQNKDVLLIGPGLARDDALPAILMEVLASWKKPAVIDAGALWALSRNKDIALNAAGPLALTPHPGELGLLLGITAADVQQNRPDAARAAARDYGAVVVLKGASTLITDPRSGMYINTTGNPILATAGSGDVLAGALAALIARGLSALDASVLAAYLHGRAGDLLAEKTGSRGGLAGEIAEYLPLAIKELVK